MEANLTTQGGEVYYKDKKKMADLKKVM